MLSDREIGKLFTKDIIDTPDPDALIEIYQKGRFGAARMGSVRTVPVVTHVFTQDELLHMVAHPIVLVPAPGVGKAILVTDGYWIQDTLAGAYTGAYAGVYATGVLTMAANAVAGDILDINSGGDHYTFVTPVNFNAPHQIPIGLTTAVTIANIVAAIMGTDGQNIAAGDVTATTGAGVINFVSTTIGANSNGYTTVYTNISGGTNHFNAATLTGGVNAKLPYLGCSIVSPFDPNVDGLIVISDNVGGHSLLTSEKVSSKIVAGLSSLEIVENRALIVYLNDAGSSVLIPTEMTGGNVASRVYVSIHYYIVPTEILT